MAVFRQTVSSEAREALAALLERPGMTPAEVEDHIDALLRYTDRRHIRLEHFLVSRRNGRVDGACLRIDGAGRMSTVFIPTQARFLNPPTVMVSLLNQLTDQARGQSVQLLQGTVVPEAELESAVYREAGFERLAQLIYMDGEVTRSEPPTDAGLAVRWSPYDAERHSRFARVVQGTYERSLDCVALNGVRDIEDILASHKSAGQFDPRFWLILDVGEEPAGVILLARQPERWALEVVYMGVLPAWRGRGCGRLLLGRAVEIARQEALETLTLTVDAGNAPALRLYRQFRFVETTRRDVWLRKL